MSLASRACRMSLASHVYERALSCLVMDCSLCGSRRRPDTVHKFQSKAVVALVAQSRACSLSQ